ncbi:MAG TPA: hypothetical protein VEO54_03165 [Thermoanaerobaculia bacterium]|nr:hypothetical protein [Thermoanaerobaculia bacterium]
MRNRIWILLVVVAACTVTAFGQTIEPATPRLDDGSTGNQMCIDCDVSGGGGWSGTSKYEQGRYLDNPCTAVQDWVWVDYSANALGNQTDPNVARYVFNENTWMGGVYKAAGSSQADVGYSNAVTTRHYHKVNTPDDFHVVTVINWNPSTKVMSLGLETACGNGMPDSKQ